MNRFLLFALIFIYPLLAECQIANDSNKHVTSDINAFPVPTENSNMLFYLQRSLDMNSVIYAANYLETSTGHRKIDSEEPVDIYWLIDDKGNSTKPLSKVQRLGYGVRAEDLAGDAVQLKLFAYRDMPIILKPSLKENRYHAHVSLDGRDVILARVFINIDGGTKLKPNVTFIEIAGTDVQTGKKITHRFRP